MSNFRRLSGKHALLECCIFRQVFDNQCRIKNVRRIVSSVTNFALPPDSVMYVFDRNAKLLQRERAAQASDVTLYDYIKDEVGYRLSDRICDIKKKFKKALDLGCGRGHVSKHISAESVEELILTDMCPSLLQQAETTEGVQVTKTVLDEEHFSWEEDSLDLIISSLSLHWVNNLPGCLKNINKSLKNDGVFLAAMFGGETLYELRSSLQLAESERDGGISAHVSPFAEIRDVGTLLNRANFTMLTIDTDEMIVGYPSMFELMWDLKGNSRGFAQDSQSGTLKALVKKPFDWSGCTVRSQAYSLFIEKIITTVLGASHRVSVYFTPIAPVPSRAPPWQLPYCVRMDYSIKVFQFIGMAENNAVRNRKLRLNKNTLLAASTIYKELYGKIKEDGTPFVPATFQIIYLVGWKPDPSQPKPLERGTGEVSLKDLYRLDEIIKETEKIRTDEDKESK